MSCVNADATARVHPGGMAAGLPIGFEYDWSLLFALEGGTALQPMEKEKALPTLRPCFALSVVFVAALSPGCSIARRPVSVGELAAAIHAVGPGGAGNRDAARAVRALSAMPPGALPELLAAMDDQGPLVQNWLCAAVDSVAERAVRAGEPLPVKALEAFVLDRGHSPAPRRLAYEWLSRVDAALAERLVPSFIDDPSTELRRDAVERELAADEKLAAADPEAARTALRRVFNAARDPDQVERAAKGLRGLGEEPDLRAHYGVLSCWRIAGPFDNTGKAGFHAVYPPEGALTAADLPAEQVGKGGAPIRWFEHRSQEPLGLINLNELIGSMKGVVAYASTTVASPTARSAQVRAMSPNAIKIWVNGALVLQRDEYHHGDDFDQHVAYMELLEGENHILVKICQNEQTEDWAGEWKFEARLCDATGGGI